MNNMNISFEGVSEQAWEKCCIDFTSYHKIPYSVAELLESFIADNNIKARK